MDFFYAQADTGSRLLRYLSLLLTSLLLSACAMTTGERYQQVMQEGKAAGFAPVSLSLIHI